jgi:CubicO group peptidase (beta-lactamase class C family)
VTLGSGIQFWCSTEPGHEHAEASGLDAVGQPVDEHSLAFLYCSAKLPLALAVMALVAEGSVQATDEIGSHVAGLQLAMAELRIEHLLDHSAGVHRPTAYQMALAPPSRWHDEIRHMAPNDSWVPGELTGFSDFVAWFLFAGLIEAVAAVPWTDFVRDQVLVPAGVAGDVVIAAPDVDVPALLPRVRVSLLPAVTRSLPALLERSPTWLACPNPSYGAYATASGLGRLLRSVLDGMGGRGPFGAWSSTLGELRQGPTSHRWDHLFERECGYRLGLLSDLRHHGFGDEVTASSFGVAGLGGTTLAMADPDADLVCVLLASSGLADYDAICARRRGAVARALATRA